MLTRIEIGAYFHFFQVECHETTELIAKPALDSPGLPNVFVWANIAEKFVEESRLASMEAQTIKEALNAINTLAATHGVRRAQGAKPTEIDRQL